MTSVAKPSSGRVCVWAGIAVLGLACPAVLSARDVGDLAPGSWVRVTTVRAGEGFVVATTTAAGQAHTHDGRTVTIEENDRPIRFARAGTTIEGKLQSIDDSTLVFAGASAGDNEGLAIHVPWAAVKSVDVRQRESKKGIGIVIGAVVGGALGYAIGATTNGPGCREDKSGFAAFCDLADAARNGERILGVLGGSVIGGLVAPGALWFRNVPLDRARVTVAPVRGRGLRVALSVGF